MKVIMVAATTVCGRISPATMGSSLDRQRLLRLRADTDASLMGAGSLRAADPEMRGPDGALDPKRVRALVSLTGDFPITDRKLFHTLPKPLVFTGTSQKPLLEKRLADRALVKELPPGPLGLDLAAGLAYLESLGVSSLLVEGGGRLNYSCLAANLVDELHLTITPKVSGQQHVAGLADGALPLGHPFLDLTLLKSETLATGEIFLLYQIRNRQ